MRLKHILYLATIGLISCTPPSSKLSSKDDRRATDMLISEKPAAVAPAIVSTWLTEKQPSPIKPYDVSESKGIRTYVTYRAISKQWGIECRTQTTGRKLGQNSCELEPLSGEIYPRTGIHKSAKNGIKIKLARSSFPQLYFFPSNMRSNSSYSIDCGKHSYNGGFGDRKTLPAFKGKEAKNIVEAMMEGNGCEAKFVNFGLGPISTWVQTNGLTDGIIFAENWLREHSE